MGFYITRGQLLEGQSRTSFVNAIAEFPDVQTIFNDSSDHPNGFLYSNAVPSLLKRFMPQREIMDDDETAKNIHELWKEFREEFPIFRWVVWDPVTLNISIFLITTFRLSAGKFFYDMIHRWLLPGKKVNIGLFFCHRF